MFLREEFKAQRMTYCKQEILSKRSKVALNIIKNIESGRKKIKPTDKDFKEMCQCLGLNPRDYFSFVTPVVTFISQNRHRTKTTIIGEVAYTLARKGVRILLIDVATSSQLSKNYNLRLDEKKYIGHALLNKEALKNYVRPTLENNIDIITSHEFISTLGWNLSQKEVELSRFDDLLKELTHEGKYDLVLIDTEAGLNFLNAMCLVASTNFVMPITCEDYTNYSIHNMANFYESVKTYNPSLKFSGALYTCSDKATVEPLLFNNLLQDKFGVPSLLFDNRIKDVYKHLKHPSFKDTVMGMANRYIKKTYFDPFADELLLKLKKEYNF